MVLTNDLPTDLLFLNHATTPYQVNVLDYTEMSGSRVMRHWPGSSLPSDSTNSSLYYHDIDKLILVMIKLMRRMLYTYIGCARHCNRSVVV